MKLTKYIPALVYLSVITATPAIAQTDTVEAPKAGEQAKTDGNYFDAIRAKSLDDDKHAEELFEKFAADKPKEPAVWYELSKLYANDRTVQKSIDAIKKAISLDSTNKWYEEQYANILAANGDYAGAAKVMAGLTRKQPHDPGYPMLAATYYEQARNYDAALDYLEKAMLRNGRDEELMMRKVQLYMSMGKTTEAEDELQRMTNRDPKNGKLYKLLGDMYDNTKQPEKATAVYNKALKALPDDPAVQVGLAAHYLKGGDTASYALYIKKAIVNKELDEDAQTELLEAYLAGLQNDSAIGKAGLPLINILMEQHPGDAQILAVYAEILSDNQQHEASLAAYKKSLAISASNFRIWEKLLENLTGKNDADSLLKYSEKAVRLFPNQAIAHYYNGIAHMNRKEYPAAIRAINRAIDMAPDNNPAAQAAMNSVLGDVYNYNKQYDLSDKAFERAMRLEPGNASLLNNYSYYLSERGERLDDAEKMSKKSLELKPGEPTYYDTYGWIAYKKGNYALAKENIQKAIDAMGSGTDATLYDHLGNVYYKLNDKEKAVECWKLAKQKGSEDAQIDKKISDRKLYE